VLEAAIDGCVPLLQEALARCWRLRPAQDQHRRWTIDVRGVGS